MSTGRHITDLKALLVSWGIPDEDIRIFHTGGNIWSLSVDVPNHGDVTVDVGPAGHEELQEGELYVLPSVYDHKYGDWYEAHGKDSVDLSWVPVADLMKVTAASVVICRASCAVQGVEGILRRNTLH